MVSYDSSAEADLPLAKLNNYPSNWLPEDLPIKREPMDEKIFIKEQNSSFYSEGFQSNSSNGTSPDSLDDKESLRYYENMQLNHKMNLIEDLQKHQLKSSPDSKSYIETIDIDNYYSSQSFSPDNLSSSPELKPTNVIPEPANFINEPTNTIGSSLSQQISSPDEQSGDLLHDSGFDGALQNKPDDETCQEGSSQENEEEPGLRTPAVNSHGKIKKHRCKQCEYVALTKFEFWRHIETHIKRDKRIYCKKCPFVTEFKHHLEYHVRNHMKIKPYKCVDCGYKCVNKSMLNSHLKSHSNIYQYQCATCSYATKYCHSLKVHLRKQRHKPGVVLNSDGSINPLPIIDVYGTRRGPKQKPIVQKVHQQPLIDKKQQQQLIQEKPQIPIAGPSKPIFANNYPFFGGMLPPFIFGSSNNNIFQPPITNRLPENVIDTASQSILQQRLSYPEPSVEESMHALRVRSPQEAATANSEPQPAAATLPAALDLTNTKTRDQASPPIQQPSKIATCPITQLTPSKNRRKGRAFKLRPPPSQNEENNAEIEENNTEKKDSASVTEFPINYMCQYCLIWFRDVTMHTVHMGFHGFNDPYMCNTCGKRSANPLEFFVHLTRAGHND